MESPSPVTRPLVLNGKFNLALDIGCFHMLKDHAGYLSNLANLLADGGQWLVYGFLASPSSRRAGGFTTALLNEIASMGLAILQRQDGSYAGRASAWFLFVLQPRSVLLPAVTDRGK